MYTIVTCPKMKTRKTIKAGRQVRSIPGDVEVVLRRESRRIGCEPSKVMRYLLARAIREFTPLDEDMILP